MMKTPHLFFRLGLLIVFVLSQAAAPAAYAANNRPVAVAGENLGIAASALAMKESASQAPASGVLVSEPVVVNPAAGKYTVVNPQDFASSKDSSVAGIPEFLRRNNYVNPPIPTSRTTSGLTIYPITAYNLIVDSNVLSPSSYGPSAATIGAKFCNESGSTMDNVWAYTGDFNSDNDANVDESGDYTPGVYPRRTSITENPSLNGATTTDYGDTSRVFALEQEAGSSNDVAEASRYIGTLAAGECRTQYWLISYPRKAFVGGSWVDVTGGVKPDDDLWLSYYFWATSSATGSTPSYVWRPVTMRNEISAMANKIWPNGDNKVPDQYLAAIQQVLGWDTITPSGGSTAYPGETVTSQGIWYDLGNVGAGFDNNNDLVPDRNIWVQPIGDAASYDPGCFRLVRTYGLVIVKLNNGTEMLIPFVDQMYFENIPSNNTGAVGLVFYEYAALDGACVAGLTPYQEVASGFDNEKFNADYGAGIPPLQSRETNMTFDKSGPGTVSLTGTINYSMTFSLPDADTNNTTTTVTVGSPSYGTPLTFYDAVPVGLQYVSGSASSTVTMTNYTSGSVAATRLYSVDGGVTWGTTDPGNYTSTSASNQLVIQWRLAEAITSPASGPAVTGTVSFSAVVPGAYTGTVVNNTGCLTLGGGDGFACDTHSTLVNGSYSITGNVFCDDGPSTGGSPCNTGSASGVSGSGWRENGSDEPGMGSITVHLYYDANNNNAVDSGDTLLSTTASTRYNVIDGYIDLDNSGTITAADSTTNFLGYRIINGAVDLNNSNSITVADAGSFAGFTVISGRLDVNRSGAVDTTDDGTIAPYYFASLPAANYVVVVDTADTDIPSGYTNTTPSTRSADITSANITDIDFAFAPALTLVKRLDTPQTTVVGQTQYVQYTLRVTNNIPGSGGPSSYCTYRVYANTVHADSVNTPPGGNSSNAQWQYTANASGAPDNRYAYSVMNDNTDLIGLSGFSLGNLGGNITGVKYYAIVSEKANLKSTDAFYIRPYYNNAAVAAYTDGFFGDGTYTRNGVNTSLPSGSSSFSGAAGSTLTLTADLTGMRSWTFADFQNNLTEVQLEANKGGGGGSSGDINLDSFYFEITTDQTCNDPSQIINPLPLTDQYEAYYLQFVSANPVQSTNTIGGSGGAATTDVGTLTWSNLGPLYPGQTKEVVVTFIAQNQSSTSPTSAISTNGDGDADNTASITTATFGNGRSTNSVTANTPVTIIASRSISGVVWFDVGTGTGNGDGWKGTATSNGYDAGDGRIPNVDIFLYVCQAPDGSYVTDTTNNRDCAYYNGTWVLFATTTTNSSGAYSFTGLYQGFYRVVVDTTTVPVGATQKGDPNEVAGNANSFNVCSTCDSQFGTATTNLTSGGLVNLVSNTSQTNVNFGYDYAAGVYGRIWEDLDDDANNSPRESTDGDLSGVTVQLYNSTCTTLLSTDVTDSDGHYFFGNLTGGTTYCIKVDTSTLPAGSTWSQMSELNNGTFDGTLNNTVTFTAAADTNLGSVDFGWRRSGTKRIGDTLFYDWNGNGVQNAGVDEGIKDITVYLYTDADGDGLVESGDYLVNTTSTFPYKVIDGQIDINGDGSITNADDGTFFGYTVIDGLIDINGGGVNSTDDGLANGVYVIDGYLDIDGDSVTAGDAGDDIEIGQYTFNNLSSKNYVVIVDTSDPQFPPSVSQTKDPDESGICSVCDSRSKVSQSEMAADGDGFIDTEDFGYYPFGSGTIGDLVWVDNNGDGIKGSTEPALSGITVLLQVDLNGDGSYSTIRTTTASSSGAYLFSNLPLGSQYNYRVVVELSTANNNIIPNDLLGNEYLYSTGTFVDAGTDYVYINATITSGSPNYLNADFGFAPPASFGDTIYQDINNNGTQDLNEPGISGVTVTLYTYTDLVGDSRYQPGDTLGSVVATATTDSSGKYQFAGLTPGYYVVVVTPPAGSTLTGDPATDGVSCLTLTPSSDPPNTVCDNRDGVRLYNATNYTGADFGYLLPGAFGDAVWIDTDGDRIYDPGETGIENITVTASTTVPANTTVTVNGSTYTAGQNINLSTSTDANGYYYFSGITIGGSSPANVTWTVTVDTADPDFPSGLTNTSEPDQLITCNVPINPTCTGYNSATTVVMNPTGSIIQVGSAPLLDDDDDGDSSDALKLDADFGYAYVGVANLSGTICLETTANGFCGDSNTDNSGAGAGETAYSSVLVFLYRLVDANNNGLYDSGETTLLVATTTTDTNGDYAFNNITTGVYYIVAVGAPQSGLNLTSTAATVNSGATADDDSETTQLVKTTSSSGDTLSAYQVINMNVGNTQGDDNVVDRDFAFQINGSYDFGDLPQGAINSVTYTYNTTLSGNPDGPRHLVPGTPTLYLGTGVDADPDGFNTSVSASADTEENGMSYPSTATENVDGWTDGTGTLQFDVTGSGWLVGWIDYNRDGDFNDANEMVINRAVSSDQDQNLDITTPTSLISDGYVYARFRLFASQPSVSAFAYSGAATSGEVEDYRIPIMGGVPTPVTLAYFNATRMGSNVKFEWMTSTEVGNAGFNLYVESNGYISLLTTTMIPSTVVDSVQGTRYEITLPAEGDTFFIEDISLDGESGMHGPFQTGQPYGSKIIPDRINLKEIYKEHINKYTGRQQSMKAGLKVPQIAFDPRTSNRSGSYLSTTLNFLVDETGIYHVTYEMLKDAGLDLKGVQTSRITLTSGGKQVPLYFGGPTGAKFGPGKYFEFYGQALDTLYTDRNVYKLQVINKAAVQISTNSLLLPKNAAFPNSYSETVTVNDQLKYSYFSPSSLSDPWYSTIMNVQATPKSWNYTFTIDNLASANDTASLNLVVWGTTSWPAITSDHHLIAMVNGVQVADVRFDGRIEKIITASIPAGALVNGTNTLTLIMPADTGSSFEYINLDRFSVAYSRTFAAQNGVLDFTSNAKAFKVTNLPEDAVTVYRETNGKFERIKNVTVKPENGAYSATFAGNGKTATYHVYANSALLTPVFEVARTPVNLNTRAQYLIISHPDFINSLQPLVDARKAQGLTVNVVDVNDVYEQYGYGITDPQAIKRYINYAGSKLGTKYVLLVGGDTYDYRNYLGLNSVSYIPSLYTATDDYARFAPVDPLYTDIDGDNLPDLPIGRFPVRTTAELNLMIQKTLSYSGRSDLNTAVFASDRFDGSVAFKDISDSMASRLPQDWSSQSIHLDDAASVAAARQQLIDAMNANPALVSYTGHSGPTVWTFSGLFNTTHAAALANTEPFVVVQWGCFNTYYVDPLNNHLTQSFLFSGNQGAAVVMGASTRTDSVSEQMLGELLMPRLAQQGVTIGDAMQAAKDELAGVKPGVVDVLLGWTLMGDPALIVNP